MDETSVSPHKYINARTEKKGWGYRLTSNHNREMPWPFVQTSEKDRIPQFSFRTNGPAWSHHSTYRQGSTGLRKEMHDFAWFSRPVLGQPAICNENLKASTVWVLAKTQSHSTCLRVRDYRLGRVYMRSRAPFPSPAHLSCHNSPQETNR